MVEIKKGHLLKAVLFDMDGVLFDSMKNHTLAWYRALSSRKIPCERDEFYQYEGATAEWTINLFLSGPIIGKRLNRRLKNYIP